MVALRALIGVATIAALVQVAIGASLTVGGLNGGWDLTTNLAAWAATQTFTVGDSLTFTYGPAHDVLEVSKADYDACATSKAINSYTGGSTVIKLSSPGSRYFICGIPGHCSQGMKLAIGVAAAVKATPPTAAAPSPLPKSSPPKPAASPTPHPPPAASPTPHPPPAASPTPLPPPTASPTPEPSKIAPSKAPSSSPSSISPSSEPPASDLPTTSPAQPSGSAADGLGQNIAKVAIGLGVGMLLVLAQ